MTTIQELNDYIEKELTNNSELRSRIHHQAVFIIRELLDDEPSLNKNNATEYTAFFCLGAAWTISQNIKHQTK